MNLLQSIQTFGLPLYAAAGITLKIAFSAMAIALVLGLLVALARLSDNRILKTVTGFYIEIIRGTPLLVQLVYIYYVLPEIGIQLEPVPAAIIGLSLNYGAYLSEVYRAAIQSIDKGQMEAALSLGYTRRRAMWHIIIPQSLLVAIPPLGNYFIALIKDTSLTSVIAVVEVLKTANILAGQTFKTVEIYTVAALLYLVISYPLSQLVHLLERRLRVSA